MKNKMLRNKSFWDKIATGYSKTGGSKWIRHPWAIKLSGNPKDKKILEIGCGTGVIINSLVKLGAIGIGIDYSEEMIKEAKKNSLKNKIDTAFFVLNAKNMRKLYNQKFDLIIFSTILVTLNSVSEIVKVFKEAGKILKNNGTILIAEPHPSFDSYMRSFLNSTSRLKNLNYYPLTKKYCLCMLDANNKKLYSYAYHWSLEDYFDAIHKSKFYVEKLFEPKPLKIAGKIDSKWYEKRSRYPSYIFLRLKKLK